MVAVSCIRGAGRPDAIIPGVADMTKKEDDAMSWRLTALRRGVVPLAALLILAVFSGMAAAQFTPRLLVTSDPKQPPNATTALLLRPNTTQPYFLYVENPGATPAVVEVQVLANGAPLPNTPLKLTLNPNDRVPVQLPPVPAATVAVTPATTPAAAASPPPTAGIDLEGPPFRFQVRLVEKGKLLDTKSVTGIMMPRDYTSASAQYNPHRSLLTVEVTAKENFVGPKCPVELVLPSERIPGFKKPKKGSFKGSLTRPGDKVVLTAENFLLPEGVSKTGFVYVTVDHYQRAFVFETNFNGGSFDPLDTRTIRIDAAPFSRPTDKFPVTIQVDNPPGPEDLSVKLGIYQDISPGEQEQEKLIDFPVGYRQEHLRVDPHGKQGAVVFSTDVNDWKYDVDASGILGKRILQAWLVNPAGERVKLVDSLGQEAAAATHLEALDDQQRHYDGVIFDDSAPEGVEFVEPVPQAVRGRMLTLQATGRDPESGIAKVAFYLARPVDDDHNPPPAAEPIKAIRSDKGWWLRLPVPKDAKGPLDVIVKFTNGVGLSTCASTSIDVVDAPVPPPPPKTGKIQGKVTWGGRLPQSDLEVILRDAKDPKAPDKKKTKTKDDGSYVFEDVDPGEYTVAAVKTENGSRSKDSQKVTVEAGKTATADLELVRKP